MGTADVYEVLQSHCGFDLQKETCRSEQNIHFGLDTLTKLPDDSTDGDAISEKSVAARSTIGV